RVTLRTRGVLAEAFLARPVVIRTTEFNRRDPETTFWGAWVRPSAPAPAFSWEAYGLVLQQSESTSLWGISGPHDRVTLGGRLLGRLPLSGSRWELEGGW